MFPHTYQILAAFVSTYELRVVVSLKFFEYFAFTAAIKKHVFDECGGVPPHSSSAYFLIAAILYAVIYDPHYILRI